MERLEPYLEDLERRIDPSIEADLMARWRAFATGQWRDGLFSPRRPAPAPPARPWPRVLVDDALVDPEAMALQQLAGCSAALEQGRGALLAVRANYGSSILPTLFGAVPFVMARETNTLPTSWPLAGGVDAIRAWVDRGRPEMPPAGDPDSLAARTLAMGRRFVDWLAPYPRLRAHVHLYHPDLQGPFDACEVLWGSRLFYDLVDEPDLVQAFLELIARTYEAFLEAWQAVVPPRDDGCAVHWSMLHRGAIMLRDDSAMNLSPAMFDEFVAPWDRRLLQRFGGGAIHFCGRGEHFVNRLPRLGGVTAVNLTQPECNDMEGIFRHTVDSGLPLLALPRGAAEAALAAGRDLRGRVHCW